MTLQGWTLILVFTALTIGFAKPMGLWLFALYEGRRTPLHKLLGPVERGFYRLAGINPEAEQGWRAYALHMLLFQLVLTLFTYAILRLQAILPLNPRALAGVQADGRRPAARAQSCRLWPWRPYRTIRRHQDYRPCGRRYGPRLRIYNMTKDLLSALRPALVLTVLFALLLGLAYPPQAGGRPIAAQAHPQRAGRGISTPW